MINEFKGKRLLILGGIKLECEIVKHAQAMGIYTIVADYQTDTPAKKISDQSVLLDATNVNEIICFCKKEKIDGIISGFVDILLRPWQQACEELGMPCYITDKMLSMSTDKIDFKKTCEKYDIPVPKTYYVGSNIEEVIFDEIQYPVFVKPLDASGSRGCGVCNSKEEMYKQFIDALSFSPTKSVVIEDYLVGREFLLDYIGENGEFKLLEMFDRYMSHDRGSARNFSNVSLAPSFAIDNYYETIDGKIKHMFKELGFKDGLIFLQGHVYKDKITFYEMGCRLGGTFFELEQACLGMNSIDMLIRYSLTGKMVEKFTEFSNKIAKFSKFAAVSNYLLAGSDETIVNIKVVDAPKEIKGWVSSIQHKDIGYHYVSDSIVDKPIISFYFTGENIFEIKEGIKYLNKTFEVTNSSGKSLLMEKFNENELEEYD